MKTLTLLALLTMPCLVWGQKKEIEVIAKISDVTVYNSAAEINYEKDLVLPKGKSTIVFTDLTPFIAANSVNVSVSDPAVNIITVSDRINYAKEKKNINEQVIHFQDSITKMNKELGFLKCRRDVAEAEKGLLFKGEAIGGLSTHGVSVAEIEKASLFFNKRYFELTKELYLLKERESELVDRVFKFHEQLKELETISVQTTSEIRVTVSNPSEKAVSFKFKFLTPKAGWAPVYDFKFEGAQRPLQFIFRANVFNASGTSWQDVMLKLSTADPIRGFALPSVNNKHDDVAAVSDVKFKQIEVVNAITEYTISHQYSVPSDARPYLIDVNSYTMPAGFNYLLIPKLDPFGFLMAKIPGWNKYNLIPGMANIYNAGTYMGKTFLDTYAESDTLSLYLGKDKNIQSGRTEKITGHPRFLIGNYSVEETYTDISIKNNSANALTVEVLDQVPVYTKEDREKLSLFNIGNAVYDKAEGLLTWSLVLQGGQSTAISFKYDIKTPKENYDREAPGRKKFRTISCPSF